MFNGTNANGVWNLWVVDDLTGDSGTIAGGWSLTVTTDVVPQPGILQFAAPTFRGAEGSGPVPITIERVGGDDGIVSVRLTTTTPATATAGADFTAIDQVVTFADGQTTASVPFTIVNDAAVEGVDETVTVALSAPTGGATLGTPTASVVTVDDDDANSDATAITIPAPGLVGVGNSPAAPYPASIHISGQPSAIGGVEVVLDGFSHTNPGDVDMLLVGPGGQNVMLMSDVGGAPDVTGLDIVFSDAGAGPLPAAGPLTSGTFTVSDNDTSGGGTDAFLPPAPAPSTATSLAAFVGTVPNGVWNLFIIDDASADAGAISGGWSLRFFPLVIADAGGPYTVGEGSPLTLNATGTSAGPAATYAWDIDGDGQFDDATGPNPTVSGATLTSLGLGDGPAGPVTVAVRVTDGPSVDTDDTTLSITNVAPTAAIGTVPTVIAGVAASFPFSATDPAAADQAAGFSYRVDWGDGSPPQTVTGGTAVTVAHTYAAAGTFTLSLSATDKDTGVSPTTTAVVTVDPPPPVVVADAGGPYTIDEGDALTLDATGTSAGPAATYAWDLDDDGAFDDATGANPTVSAATLATLGFGDGPAGPADVTVQVTEGPTVDTDATTLAVVNVAPTATVDAVPTVVEGVPASFSFSATDGAAADAAAGFTYTIDWGDGSSPQAVTGGASVIVAHTYAADGTFVVAVTATDKDGATGAADTATVTVDPEAVADAGGPYTIAEGAPLTLDATGTSAGPTATFAWDLDDDGAFDDATGASPTITAATLATLGFGDGPAGPADITVQVTDGLSVDTDTTTLAVVNVAPTAAVGTVPTVVAGTAVSVPFSATDPAPADEAAGFTYTIDWGDGSPAQAVTGGTGVTVDHTFAAAGTFTVTVSATDKDGGISTATGTVTVLAAAPVVVADAGGPYTIDEGDALTLDATGTTTTGTAASFAWDLDGDGAFDDATGASPTIDATDLPPALADGLATATPVPIAVQVTDEPTIDTDDTTVTVSNVAPVATVDLPGPIVAGTPVTVKVGAIDPSPVDAAALFTYDVDWEGDGVIDLTVEGPADPPVTHTYTSAGDVGLTVTATDKDGASSTPTVTEVSVGPAAPADGSGDGDGTTGADRGDRHRHGWDHGAPPPHRRRLRHLPGGRRGADRRRRRPGGRGPPGPTPPPHRSVGTTPPRRRPRRGVGRSPPGGGRGRHGLDAMVGQDVGRHPGGCGGGSGRRPVGQDVGRRRGGRGPVG